MYDFKSPEEETRFVSIFENKLQWYKFLIDKVRDEFFGTISYNAMGGERFSKLTDITSELIYKTSDDFEEEYQEYKESSIFMKKEDLSDCVKNAIQEAQVESKGLSEFSLGDA
jgi:hypothetical protein